MYYVASEDSPITGSNCGQAGHNKRPCSEKTKDKPLGITKSNTITVLGNASGLWQAACTHILNFDGDVPVVKLCYQIVLFDDCTGQHPNGHSHVLILGRHWGAKINILQVGE